MVNTRASVLNAIDLLDAAALDPYTFTRDAYLQKRLNDVYDGNPPVDEERYDLDEADPAAGSVSHVSPLARAVVGRRVGDEVKVAGQAAEITAVG